MAYILSSNEQTDFVASGILPGVVNLIDINEVKLTNEEFDFTSFGVMKVFDINDVAAKSSGHMMLMGVG